MKKIKILACEYMYTYILLTSLCRPTPQPSGYLSQRRRYHAAAATIIVGGSAHAARTLIDGDNAAATRCVPMQVASHDGSSGSERSANETPNYMCCQRQLQDTSVHVADTAPSWTSCQPLPALANAGCLCPPQPRRRWRQQQQWGLQILRQCNHNGDYDTGSSNDGEAAARQR